MSRWSDAFAALSSGHDTVDTLRQSDEIAEVSRADGEVYLAEAPVLARAEPTLAGDLPPGRRIPEPAVLLADGRRLHRLAASHIPDHEVDGVKELMEAACGYGVGLWADGMTLVVVEAWGRILPALLFNELRQHAGAVILELRSESRARGNWMVFDPP